MDEVGSRKGNILISSSSFSTIHASYPLCSLAFPFGNCAAFFSSQVPLIEFFLSFSITSARAFMAFMFYSAYAFECVFGILSNPHFQYSSLSLKFRKPSVKLRKRRAVIGTVQIPANRRDPFFQDWFHCQMIFHVFTGAKKTTCRTQFTGSMSILSIDSESVSLKSN